MNWFDRERMRAGLTPKGEAPGWRGLLVTFVVVVAVFLIVAAASGWVHITKVAP